MVGAVQRFMMLKSKFNNLARTLQLYALGVCKRPDIFWVKFFFLLKGEKKIEIRDLW